MANDLLGRIEEWRRKLLDLTNRNQLVSCKIGPRAAIRLEYPSPGQFWSGLLGGADLTFAWKRELVPDANESGDDNSAPPQLSLFASKGKGPPPNAVQKMGSLKSKKVISQKTSSSCIK